jgi:hypothetical protein
MTEGKAGQGAGRQSLREQADQLRARIDSGRTGDKVNVSDPAACPLGTDAESGSPHDEEGLRVAREAGQRSPGQKR